MFELEVVEMTVDVKVGKEFWQGTSFWECPSHQSLWSMLTSIVTDTLKPELLNLLQPGLPWKVKVSGQYYTMTGPLAIKMKKHFDRCIQAKSSRWAWELLKGTRFSLPEGKDGTNGQV